MRISPESEREHDPDACGSSESDTWGVGDNPPLGWSGDVLGEQPSLPSGARVGKYQLLGPLGRGGVATVYRARHVDDPTREVALKLFEPSWRLSQAQLALGHFSNRELRIASQVDHPHLVRLAVGVAASVNQWVADWSAEPAESPDTQVVESGRIQGPD